MKRFARPGYILGVIAVALTMSGSAVAASKITSKQIKDGTITGKDIKNYSVSTSKLTAGTMDDLTGPAGPQGPAGAPGLAGVQTVESPHISLAPGTVSPAAWMAQCPPGKYVIGTGFYSSVAHTSFVKTYGTFAGAFVYNDSNIIVNDIHFQAICASVSGAVASSAGGKSAAYARDRERAFARTLG